MMMMAQQCENGLFQPVHVCISMSCFFSECTVQDTSEEEEGDWRVRGGGKLNLVAASWRVVFLLFFFSSFL